MKIKKYLRKKENFTISPVGKIKYISFKKYENGDEIMTLHIKGNKWEANRHQRVRQYFENYFNLNLSNYAENIKYMCYLVYPK